MRSPISFYIWRLAQAICITMLVAAAIHLAIAGLSFAETGQVAYINPIAFLGFGPLLPSYLNSSLATIAAWTVLIGTCLTIFVCREWLGIPWPRNNSRIFTSDETDQR